MGNDGHNVLQERALKSFLRKDLPDFFALAFRNLCNVAGLDLSCLCNALEITGGFLVVTDRHAEPIGA